jgi:hypothetical protein
MNDETDLGRTEILSPSAPLTSSLPNLDPDVAQPLLKLDESEERLEDLMLRYYIAVLEDSNAKHSDGLKAAKDVATMIGKAGTTQKLTLIQADNAQINQLNENPDLLQHMRRAAQGLSSLSEATETTVITSRGGQGI